MQVLDEKKRLKILSAAAERFASQPFHKVLLSDVADSAGVGKGTLYIYFKSKEDLYLSVLYAGFSNLLERFETWINEETHSPSENLEAVVRELVASSLQNPHYYEVMRTVQHSHAQYRTKWHQLRHEILGVIESVIRKGISLGHFEDPHPDLTARIILGCARSLIIDGPATETASTMTAHILRIIMSAIRKKEANS